MPAVERRAESPRLRALDGLRFIAALAVVLYHYTARNSPTWGHTRDVFPGLSSLTTYGFFGPYLFFMISGFVVLLSAEGRTATSFLASRVGRLYPAYWVAVVITAVVTFCVPGTLIPWSQLHMSGALVNLTMFQAAFGVPHVDGVYWTLWVEWKFYLLLVGLILVGITRGRLLALCAVWPVMGAFAVQVHSDLIAGLLEPNYAPFFCIGILLYMTKRHGMTPTVGLLLGLNTALALHVSVTYCLASVQPMVDVPVSGPRLAVLFLLCLVAVVGVTLTPLAGLNWRCLTWLGALTYPLYLLHEELGWALMRHWKGDVPVGVLVAGIMLGMLGLSWLVHRLVELPLGRRLRRGMEREFSSLGAPGAVPPMGEDPRSASSLHEVGGVPRAAGTDTREQSVLRPGVRDLSALRRVAVVASDAAREA